MTKTYDLVTLYYRGHSPLKKEDNSFFLCLYTMLFVLFVMVVILLACTFYNIEPTESSVDLHNIPQPLKTKKTTFKPITTKTSPHVTPNYDYEETAKPFVNWDKVVDFFVGQEEPDENSPNEDMSQATTRGPPLNSTLSGKNESVPVIRSTKEEKSKQTSSVPPLIKRPEVMDEDSSKAPEGSSQKNEDTNTPSHTSPGQKGTWFEGSLADTDSSKDSNTSPSFNEWPEATSDTTENLNGEVELVPSAQNSTFGNETANLEVQKDCKFTRCELAASKIMSSINLSVDPCSNFYSFACGGASSRRRGEPELFSEESSSGLGFVKKFELFHKSCLEHEIHFNYRDRVQRVKRLLSDVGMLDFDREQDLTDVIGSLVLFDAMPLINIDIDVSNSRFILKMLPLDSRLTSKYWSPLAETRRNCLRTIQPDINSSPLDITLLYYDYEECQRNHNDYLKSLETAIDELGNFGNLTDIQRKKSIEDTTLYFRKFVWPMLNDMLSVPDRQERIMNLQYDKMNIKDLQKQFPVIDWYKFFKKLSFDEIKTTSSLLVYDKTYFEILFRKLSSLETNQLIRGFNAILAEKYYQELVLPTPKHSRAKYCSKLNRKLFPDISNYLYRKVKANKDFNERKNYIKATFRNMKQDYKNTLQNLKWLDDASRSSMTNKINSLKLETYRNDSKNESDSLHKLYLKLKLKQGDYSFNYKEATQFRIKTIISLHDKPVTTENIFRNLVDNLETAPVFFYGHHIVYIPDELIHETFIDLPRYLIMARIGFPLAKIIGHTFDPIGIKFDLQLSDNVSSLYNKFLHESRRTLPHHLDFNKLNLVFGLNSRVSTVERIAENSAMAILTNSIDEIQYQALLPWVSYTFSREKIFFMALVQEFCSDISLMEFVVLAHESPVLPPQFRVQNILQNCEAFNAQFSCRPKNLLPLQFPHLDVLLSKYYDKIT